MSGRAWRVVYRGIGLAMEKTVPELGSRACLFEHDAFGVAIVHEYEFTAVDVDRRRAIAQYRTTRLAA